MVVTSTARSWPFASTRMPLSPSVTTDAGLAQLGDEGLQVVARARRVTRTAPPVIAAATMKRAGLDAIGDDVVHRRRAAPDALDRRPRSVPAPVDRRAHPLERAARGTRSPARARRSRSRSCPRRAPPPSSAAGSRRPTGSRAAMCAPCSRVGLGLDVAVARCASRAPIFSRPARCRSTGRAPIAQPPGVETRAWPKRASSGPSARNDARMVFTSSYGASVRSTSRASTDDVVPVGTRASTRAPRCASTSSVVRMSASAGTLRSAHALAA